MGGGGDGVVAGLVVDVAAVGVFVVGFVFGVSGVGDGCGDGSLGVGGGGRSPVGGVADAGVCGGLGDRFPFGLAGLVAGPRIPDLKPTESVPVPSLCAANTRIGTEPDLWVSRLLSVRRPSEW